jgi:hypothetical protein
MDLILDSMSPMPDYPEELLMEIAVRSQDWTVLRSREYNFADPQSLELYWSDQATCMIWAGLGMDEEWSSPANVSSGMGGVSQRESFERSTAQWEVAGEV